MTKHVPRIITAVVGLALVVYGGWLVMHDVVEAGTLALVGGLGTLGLPAVVPPRDPESKRPRRIPPLPLLMLLIAIGMLVGGCGGGAAGVAAAASTATTVRDVGCQGGRWMCRWTDRACRLTGGPWVVPRSAEEIAADADASRSTSPMIPTVEVEPEPAESAGQ